MLNNHSNETDVNITMPDLFVLGIPETIPKTRVIGDFTRKRAQYESLDICIDDSNTTEMYSIQSLARGH